MDRRTPVGAAPVATMLVAFVLVLDPLGCKREPRPEEARDFVVTVENRTPLLSLYSSGLFEKPEGAIEPTLLEPGQSYELEVEVGPNARFQLITMFAESNDAFVAFEPEGIELWTAAGEAIEGERSLELVLWDAGTELNELPGDGPTQLRRQSEPGVGEAEESVITRIVEAGAVSGVGPQGHTFPAPDRFVSVEFEHLEALRFRVTLTNISPEDLLPQSSGMPRAALLSPGVYAIHDPQLSIFEVGEPAPLELEWLAEDAEPEPLAQLLLEARGVASELSSVVWAVHPGDVKLYELEELAGPGLEALAEDGDPLPLLDHLTKDADRMDLVGYGIADADPRLAPGVSLTFHIRAEPDDHLSLVTAYLAANDKFLGLGQSGIPLFDEGGEPRTGDFSWALQLLDAGTEVDESLGLGPHQFPRQPELGAGIREYGTVRRILGPWMDITYPLPERIVGVQVEIVENGDGTGGAQPP